MKSAVQTYSSHIMMAPPNGLEGLAATSSPAAGGLDAMQSGARQTSPEAFFGGGAVETQIKQEEGAVPARSAAVVGATHSVMSSARGPQQAPCQIDSKGNVIPVPPPKQGEAGDNLPWTDKGYLPVHVGGGKSPPSKKKPRRTKMEGKVAMKVKRAKFTRRGRVSKKWKNLSKGINKEFLDKFRSAEYTRTDQQLRTEARLKRLQEIYAHEVSGAALDEQMKKEKLKLIELENNRRAAKVSRAKKRQYIRDLEQRVEMFSKHIATLEMENSELRAALNKNGVGGSAGHHGGMQMPAQMQQMQEMPMANSMEPAAPQMDPNMMAMMSGMNPMMMGMGMMGQQTPSAPPGTSSAPQSSITSPNGKQPKMEPNTSAPGGVAQQQQAMQQQMMAMMMGGMGMMPGMMGGMGGMQMPGMGMSMDPNAQQMMGQMGHMEQPNPVVKAEPMS